MSEDMDPNLLIPERLEALEANFLKLRYSFGDHEDALTELIAQQQVQNDLLSELANEISKNSQDGRSPNTRGWSAWATPADWHDLIVWVDELAQTYEARMILPCWPLHAGVVEELAALRLAWLDAVGEMYLAPDDEADVNPETGAIEEPKGGRWKTSDRYAFWHDRCLVPALMRLNTTNSIHSIKNCKNSAHQDRREVPKVDKELVAKLTAGLDTDTVAPEPTWRSVAE